MKLIQLPTLSFEQKLQQELEENPALEAGKEATENQDFDTIDLYSKELIKMATKFSLTDIVEIVHKFTKINKNKIYKWLLKLKK